MTPYQHKLIQICVEHIEGNEIGVGQYMLEMPPRSIWINLIQIGGTLQRHQNECNFVAVNTWDLVLNKEANAK